MASNITNIKKLQTAINLKGEKILYSTSQWYSEEQQRPITIYHIKKAIYDENLNKNINIELFKSTSMIQILLFLRDYWFKLNCKELPIDNLEWNEIRKELMKNDTLI